METKAECIDIASDGDDGSDWNEDVEDDDGHELGMHGELGMTNNTWSIASSSRSDLPADENESHQVSHDPYRSESPGTDP